MRTTRLSWLLLLASAITLTGVVAVLAPDEDLQQRAGAPYVPRMTPQGPGTVAAPVGVPRVAPGTFLESPRGPREHRWPFSDWYLPDPVRMILY
ncbi:MAG: hypothetical protein ACM4AI_13515 [Acidobacteriota bacterium]